MNMNTGDVSTFAIVSGPDLRMCMCVCTQRKNFERRQVLMGGGKNIEAEKFQNGKTEAWQKMKEKKG